MWIFYSNAHTPYQFDIHLNPVVISDFVIVGYSGCDSDYYGKNPSLKHLKNKEFSYDEGNKINQIARQIRKQELSKLINNLNVSPDKIVLVSHERIGRLWFKPKLHLFGHLHTNYRRQFKNIEYVNVAQLDYGEKDKNSIYAIIDVETTHIDVLFKKLRRPFFKLFK